MPRKGHWYVLVSILAVIGCDSGSTEPETAASARPNFVLILTDDLDQQLIPHLERVKALLATEGATFRNFFVTSSICCPSRVSFLTGQYAHNHGVLTNGGVRGGFRVFNELGLERRTIAHHLREAGYRTALIGKFMNGYPLRGRERYVPPGWTEWYATIDGQYFDYRVNENGVIVDYPCCDTYETDIQTSKAVDFIRRAVAAGEPFFLHLNPQAPHAPAIPAARHRGAFSDLQAPRTPSFNEIDASDKPTQIATRPPLRPGQVSALDERFREGLRSVLAVEDMLDSLVVTLRATGVLNRTYILFTSDNGFHYGEHRLGPGKTTAYDEDIRVPLFVRGPGVGRGRIIDQIVLNIDIAPTLAHLGGTSGLAFVDGRSFARLLSQTPGSPGDWRDGFLVERWNPVGSPSYFSATGYRALRTLDYLYVEWDTGEYELYDRQRDPFEIENIYSTADPALRTSLSSWLGRLSSCWMFSCDLVED